MQKIAAENLTAKQPLWSPVLMAILTGVGSHRWWEDDLCGHATLASAYALSFRGHDTWPVRFHTTSGLLTVNRDSTGSEFNIKDWKGKGGTAYSLSVVEGQIRSAQANGEVY